MARTASLDSGVGRADPSCSSRRWWRRCAPCSRSPASGRLHMQPPGGAGPPSLPWVPASSCSRTRSVDWRSRRSVAAASNRSSNIRRCCTTRPCSTPAWSRRSPRGWSPSRRLTNRAGGPRLGHFSHSASRSSRWVRRPGRTGRTWNSVGADSGDGTRSRTGYSSPGSSRWRRCTSWDNPGTTGSSPGSVRHRGSRSWCAPP